MVGVKQIMAANVHNRSQMVQGDRRGSDARGKHSHNRRCGLARVTECADRGPERTREEAQIGAGP